MSDSSIIKEFLVALGVKVDDDAIKRFQGGIDKASKIVGGFATAAEAMAAAVEVAVVKVSSKFEDLYYASQRIGDSVQNITDYDFAIGQLGGTAKGAQQALENMGEFFRSNPGAERFVQGLGVATRDAKGQLRDMTAIMGELGKKFRDMPYSHAKVVAAVLGIDPQQLQAMIRGANGDLDKWEADRKARAARMGVDLDKASRSSKDFMNDFREFMSFLTLAMDRVVLVVQPIADQVVKWLEAADDATDGWSTAMIGLAAVLVPILALVGPVAAGIAAIAAAIVFLWNDYEQWKKGSDSLIDWGKWSDDIDNVLAAIKPLWQALQNLLGALKPIWDFLVRFLGPVLEGMVHGALRSFADDLHFVTDVINFLADSIRVVVDILQGKWGQAWKDAKQVAIDGAKGLIDAGKSMVHLLPGVQLPGDGDEGPTRRARAAAAAAPAKPAPRAAGDSEPAADGGRGPWGARAGPGGAYGSGVAPSGVAAKISQTATAVRDHILARLQQAGIKTARGITAGIGAETHFKVNAFNAAGGGHGAFGIGQWRGERLRKLRAKYGQNPTLDQQIEFLLWELRGGDAGGRSVLAANTDQGALSAYVNQFMRPGAAGAIGDMHRGMDYLRGLEGVRVGGGGSQTNVSMAQKTDIHVYGRGDAASTGREVAAEQDRVNGNLVRQFQARAS